MRLISVLASALVATRVSAGDAPSPLAANKLATCLTDRIGIPAPATASSEIPPGLARKDVSIEKIPGNGVRGYAYHANSRSEIACGIALYGPVSSGEISALVSEVIKEKPSYSKSSADSYRLTAAAPAHITYYADPKAPALSGVLIFEREPSAKTPSVEIDYHRSLIM